MRARRRSSRAGAGLLLVAVVLTACGQKPILLVQGEELPVHALPDNALDEGDGPSTDPLPTGDDPAGPTPGPATTEPDQPANQQPAQQPAQPTGQQQQPPPQQPTQPQAQQQARGSDRTGVTDSTITVAAHAPVTGAAPLPALVFEQSADLYWRWLHDEKDELVLGRRVEVRFQDDRYEPSTARQVCRQLMQQGFSLTGAGADGIAACGQLAGQLGVPYVSLGADEGTLAGNPWYYAMSITYPQQGELWTQYVARHFPGQRAGAIAINTANWNAAVDAWHDGLQRRGIDHVETLRHPRDDSAWYASYAKRLHDDGVQVVYALTSPLHLIRFARVAHDNNYGFTILHISPGGLNAVLENGCPGLSNALAFSAWPSIDVIDQIDPDFRRAISKFEISEVNLDLSLALWGVNKAAHQMFLHYERTVGTDLTREDFRAAIESMTVSSGVFPDQTYTRDNHFGTTPGTHVLKADCSRAVWGDGGTFKTGF